ncbi:hypothetical protein [Pediococcus acidilactici]|uniref:hypothetical protein n=1 Tax=Pediococcus acidilactici TaxID=1254 RepID=UPI001EF6819B|nr:hypothetical protein [Pediococcus acidilactici]
MKLFKRIIKYLLILIGGAGLAIVIAINVSPRPFVFFLNHAAKDEAAIRPRAYQSYRDQISIKKDVRYSSQSAKNTMDIFYKKDNRTKPTIIWAHGAPLLLVISREPLTGLLKWRQMGITSYQLTIRLLRIASIPPK